MQSFCFPSASGSHHTGKCRRVVSVCVDFVCVCARTLVPTAAKYLGYVFQGAGSEEAHVSEDRGVRPLWPRRLPMGGSQKAQILNRVKLFPPQACRCILQRSLRDHGGTGPFTIFFHYDSILVTLSSRLQPLCRSPHHPPPCRLAFVFCCWYCPARY